ncbi:MAG: excinuclease ABC subunit UvrA [Acidobacteriota bacterium]
MDGKANGGAAPAGGGRPVTAAAEGRIVVRGASENNLRSVNVDIPANRITVVTGVSGSGKSSLAFDVVYREAQRRYLESFSAYARQFMGKLRRPDVAHIEGLSPAIAVGQRTVTGSPRSTVGTLTELYDDLRLLYARLGQAPAGVRPERRLFSFNSPYGACPECRGLGVEDRIVPDLLVADPAKTLRQGALAITTPSGYIIYSQVTMDVLDQVCRAHGFSVDIPWQDLTEEQRDVVLDGSDRVLIPYGKHPLESRLRWTGITARPREEGRYKGILPVMEAILRQKRNRNILRFARTMACRACGGRRLRPEALAVTFRGRSIAAAAAMSVSELAAFFRGLAFSAKEEAVGRAVRDTVLKRTDLLERLGLGYLALDRESGTLSEGEAQRIRLANQAGGGLRGVLYVLDEPTAGLHPSDTQKLLDVLRELRDNGNTLLVVEHDEAVIRAADHLIDLGPGAGVDGGRVLYSGPPEGLVALPAGSGPTRDHLAGDLVVPAPAKRREGKGAVAVTGARLYNLKTIDVRFRLGAFNVVTGVSGAGKSTLVKRVLAARLRDGRLGPGPDASAVLIDGRIGKIVEIDQSPIGRTPRSNPATYTGLSDRVRDLFAALPEARRRGWDKGRFSFNVKGGRCETCQGAGLIQIGMHFLGDVEVVCPDCGGRRFNDETLEVACRGRTISDILDMSVAEAASFFDGERSIGRILEVMVRLGLGYLKLGQSSTTLSGGEAQRIRLASELSRPESGKTLYVLEEPTTGLHPHDVKNLLGSLQELVDKGNTIIAIEHDPEFIVAADFVLDLGPGSGAEGGRVVVSGPPEAVAAEPASLTGRALRARGGIGGRPAPGRRELPAPLAPADPIRLAGVTTHNLKAIDVSIPFNRLTVVCGPSGCGKSSLAFDTLFAESLERYIESFSTYVRGLIAKGERPDVVSCRGLTPPIAVSPKAAAHHPRSTVGTMTEIYDYYRLLFSRAGELPEGASGGGKPLAASLFSFNHEQGACGRCKGLGRLTVCDPDLLVTDPDKPLTDGALDGTKTGRFYGERHGQYVAALAAAGRAAGIDFGVPYSELGAEARRVAMRGTGDRIYDIVWSYKRKARSGDFKFKGPWKGFANLVDEEYERKHADDRGRAMLGLMKDEPCPACGGARLRPEALAVTFLGMNIAALSALTAAEAIRLFEDEGRRTGRGDRARAVTEAVRAEILRRLRLMSDVGLGYLAIDRRSATLSGGEAQRLRLAGELGARLSGVSYILDEPTAGLHPRDTERLIALLRDLARRRNTVVVVEHDPAVIGAADHVIDMGPGAGRAGGRIVAEGTPAEVAANPLSPTGRYLSAGRPSPAGLPGTPRPGLRIAGARANNLRSIDVEIPSGVLTAVTGVSGSGKSSLVFDVLRASAAAGRPVGCSAVEGLGRFSGVVQVDQAGLAASSRGIPATYAGFFDTIRTLFASEAAAESRGFGKAHFSFLTKEGRCETCGGAGKTSVSMDFLADVQMPCETCGGARYRPEVLEIAYRGKTIADVLALTAVEAKEFFAGRAAIERPLGLLEEIGLGYLAIGQPLDTLSGGEAQRLRLAAGLMRPAAGACLYLFDEPTTGLHFTDIERLLGVFGRLIGHGHTLVVIEHDLQVIEAAHHVIDLGPEGGEGGGTVVAAGSPGDIAAEPRSFTGAALRTRRARSGAPDRKKDKETQ